MSRLIILDDYKLNQVPLGDLSAFARAHRLGDRMDSAAAQAAVECVVPSDARIRAAVERLWPERARMDAAFSVAFGEELKHVFQEVLRQPMPEYPFANGDVLPFNTEVALGKKTYEYHLLSYTGHAEVLASYAWRKLPSVQVAGDAQIGHVKRFGCTWGITEDDELAQAHTQIKLDRELPIAARRAHVQLWDQHFSFGWQGGKLLGALNHPNVPVIDAPLNAGNTSTYWADKTADEIVDDVRLLVRHLPGLTNEMENPDTVLMSPSEMTLISTRKMSTASDTTILSFLKQAFPEVTFGKLNTLKANMSYGNLATNALFAFKRDPKKSALVVVEPFRQREPIQDGLEKVVICTSGHGGALIRFPYSLVRMDGVGLN